MMRTVSIFGAAFVLAISGWAFGDALAVDEATYTAQICKEAQERYKGMAIPKPSGPDTAVVLLYKYRFCPPDLSIKKGTTVHFINIDTRTSHSVWFQAAGKPESDRYFPEESWSMKFDAPGDYPYLCGPHWESEKMVGKITVTP